MAVDYRPKTTLEEKINKYVNKESIVYIDCWKGYNGFNEQNYIHKTVNLSVSFVNYENRTHTNTI